MLHRLHLTVLASFFTYFFKTLGAFIEEFIEDIFTFEDAEVDEELMRMPEVTFISGIKL